MLERHYHPNTHAHNSIKLDGLADKTTIHIVGSRVQRPSQSQRSYRWLCTSQRLRKSNIKPLLLRPICLYSFTTLYSFKSRRLLLLLSWFYDWQVTQTLCQLFTVNLIFRLDWGTLTCLKEQTKLVHLHSSLCYLTSNYDDHLLWQKKNEVKKEVKGKLVHTVPLTVQEPHEVISNFPSPRQVECWIAWSLGVDSQPVFNITAQSVVNRPGSADCNHHSWWWSSRSARAWNGVLLSSSQTRDGDNPDHMIRKVRTLRAVAKVQKINKQTKTHTLNNDHILDSHAVWIRGGWILHWQTSDQQQQQREPWGWMPFKGMFNWFGVHLILLLQRLHWCEAVCSATVSYAAERYHSNHT